MPAKAKVVAERLRVLRRRKSKAREVLSYLLNKIGHSLTEVPFTTLGIALGFGDAMLRIDNEMTNTTDDLEAALLQTDLDQLSEAEKVTMRQALKILGIN